MKFNFCFHIFFQNNHQVFAMFLVRKKHVRVFLGFIWESFNNVFDEVFVTFSCNAFLTFANVFFGFCFTDYHRQRLFTWVATFFLRFFATFFLRFYCPRDTCGKGFFLVLVRQQRWQSKPKKNLHNVLFLTKNMIENVYKITSKSKFSTHFAQIPYHLHPALSYSLFKGVISSVQF